MRVYVTTSDKYHKALAGFCHLTTKYWPEVEVVVVGFAEPRFALPPKFSFMSLGDQADFPVNMWSDALLLLMTRIKDSHFILMLEDYYLLRKVDHAGVEHLFDYATKHPEVARLDLTADRLYAGGVDLNYGVTGHFDLVKSKEDSPYHLSLMAGVWSKQWLRKVIIPGETPWDIEISGTPRLQKLSKEDGAIVLGTKQIPLRYTLAHRGGNSAELLTGEILNKEDAEAVVTIWKGML